MNAPGEGTGGHLPPMMLVQRSFDGKIICNAGAMTRWSARYATAAELLQQLRAEIAALPQIPELRADYAQQALQMVEVLSELAAVDSSLLRQRAVWAALAAENPRLNAFLTNVERQRTWVPFLLNAPGHLSSFQWSLSYKASRFANPAVAGVDELVSSKTFEQMMRWADQQTTIHHGQLADRLGIPVKYRLLNSKLYRATRFADDVATPLRRASGLLNLEWIRFGKYGAGGFAGGLDVALAGYLQYLSDADSIEVMFHTGDERARRIGVAAGSQVPAAALGVGCVVAGVATFGLAGLACAGGVIALSLAGGAVASEINDEFFEGDKTPSFAKFKEEVRRLEKKNWPRQREQLYDDMVAAARQKLWEENGSRTGPRGARIGYHASEQELIDAGLLATSRKAFVDVPMPHLTPIDKYFREPELRTYYEDELLKHSHERNAKFDDKVLEARTKYWREREDNVRQRSYNIRNHKPSEADLLRDGLLAQSRREYVVGDH